LEILVNEKNQLTLVEFHQKLVIFIQFFGEKRAPQKALYLKFDPASFLLSSKREKMRAELVLFPQCLIWIVITVLQKVSSIICSDASNLGPLVPVPFMLCTLCFPSLGGPDYY